MRISDLSSDVCSSDLPGRDRVDQPLLEPRVVGVGQAARQRGQQAVREDVGEGGDQAHAGCCIRKAAARALVSKAESGPSPQPRSRGRARGPGAGSAWGYLNDTCVSAARSAAIALGGSGCWMMPAMRPCGSGPAMVAEWARVWIGRATGRER